ncbi:MAG: hypothetical protein ACLGSA_08895 [Acidobacteriota bacterium]
MTHGVGPEEPRDPASAGKPDKPGERIEFAPNASRPALPRGLLLLVVVLGTIWAYSWHFENMAQRIKAQDAISDETGLLPPQRLALLRDADHAMREAYGISLRIQVRTGPVQAPPSDPRVLFIGLDTSSGTSVVQLPPLVARALPSGLAQSLANDYFQPYFAAGAWPEGLYACVLTILEALRDPN